MLFPTDSEANRHRSPAPPCHPRQKDWLSSKDLPLRLDSWRLAPKFIRPVGVDGIVYPSSISLKHSSSLKIHPTFLSLLKPVSESDPVPISNPPSPSLVIAAPAYTVRQILDVRLHRRGLQFLVDWNRYSPEEQAWVPRHHIDDGLWDFYQGHPDLARAGCVPAADQHNWKAF